MELKRYRKKPVEIHAIRWEGEWKPIYEWLEAVTNGVIPGIRNPDNSLNIGGQPIIRREGDKLLIDTREGTMTALNGDWIILGVAGEFYPCNPEIFEATYEPVD